MNRTRDAPFANEQDFLIFFSKLYFLRNKYSILRASAILNIYEP